MKRKITILTTIAILMLLASVAGAHGYYRSFGSLRNRARWSPYAFGLVSDDVRYSPYAFRVGHNGLVRRDVCYTPYALTHKSSGLITEDGKPYRPGRTSDRIIYVVGYSLGVRPSCTQSQAPDYKEMRERRERMVRARKNEREKINAEKEKYGKKIAAVLNFLKSQNMGDFEIMYGRVSVAGKRDAYFISRDNRNRITVIRYSGIVSRSPYYEKYENEWRAFQELCKEHKDIIQVYAIKAVDEEGIKAQLQKLFDS